MTPPDDFRLVRPARPHLAGYRAALERGWSPQVGRPASSDEHRAMLASDPEGLLKSMEDPEGQGRWVTLPDGSQRPPLPSLRRWMWRGPDDCPQGFVGSINLRWTPDGSPLPAHVLGHIGYSVAEWCQGRGYAKRALALMLEIATARGMTHVEITTDLSNLASQRVIEANGGRRLELFWMPEAVRQGVRYLIPLQ